jgi:hypothetical protein
MLEVTQKQHKMFKGHLIEREETKQRKNMEFRIISFRGTNSMQASEMSADVEYYGHGIDTFTQLTLFA